MNALLNWLEQVGAITKLNLQTIVERKGSSAAAAFGIAGVVAVLVGVLSIGQGFRRAMTTGGSPDTALVLRSGADSEMMSILTREDTRLIADTPGIVRTDQGALASAELFAVIDLPKRSTGTSANIPLRGVEWPAFAVYKGFQIVQGRRFEPGRNEVIVGAGAAREFAGLDVGSRIKVGRNEWEVVGLFTTEGGLAESEIWTDVAVLQPAYERGNTFQCVYAKLTSPEAFDGFKEALMQNPQLNVKVLRQTEYYADQSRMVHNLVTVLGTIVASLMALGAVFGALNTMYSAVSARTREIATLRALGFGGGPILISILAESIVLAMVGGTVGAVGAWVAFDGFQAATLNWQTFSQVAFAFAVTPQLLVAGVFLALGIGLIGGIFPAVRAMRMPIAIALREM